MNRRAGKGIGQPGFVESLIPIWGSGRAAIDDFQNGRWGWGIFNTAMAISDVFLVKAVATAAVKGAVKVAAKSFAKEVASLMAQAPYKIGNRKLYLEVGKPAIEKLEKEFLDCGGKIIRHTKPNPGKAIAGQFVSQEKVIHLYPGSNKGTLAEELIHFKQSQVAGIFGKAGFKKAEVAFWENQAKETLKKWGFMPK